jgi:hypothetical protein
MVQVVLKAFFLVWIIFAIWAVGRKKRKEVEPMALAHRRLYGIYRWLAHAPDWFYQCDLGCLLGYRLTQITANHPSGPQERQAAPNRSGSVAV